MAGFSLLVLAAVIEMQKSHQKRENRSRFINCKEKNFNYHPVCALNALTKTYAGESVCRIWP